MLGWTVSEAAQRLLCSDATIRRRVEAGELETESGKPMRITRASVAAAQVDMLKQMQVDPETVAAALGPASSPTTIEEENRRLKDQVRFLKGALADLTAAHSATLDTFRRASDQPFGAE